jgi:hypothetical protein
MKEKKLTKEERLARKLKRKASRDNILALLANLKGKDIMTMNDNQIKKTMVVICDHLGISQNGIIQ